MLAGCVSPQVHRLAVGRVGSSDATPVPDLAPRERPDRPPAGADAPSSPTLARTWAPMTVHLPVDGTYAFPRYTRGHVWTDTTARQRGDFPSALTALELEGETTWTRLGEMGAGGPIAVFEAVVMVPRMLMHDPRRRVRTLPEPYWRANAGVAVAQPAEPK
ncbi:MAG: hypothetical protein HBSAPP03_20450 [Phycisphaerae bacterium]|nr:MAG: hypothetical protein HBSAPP03_20450 [Phycisphaerae bacterium]